MSFASKRDALIALWGDGKSQSIDQKITQMEGICGNDNKLKILECLTSSDLNIERAIAAYFSGNTPQASSPTPEHPKPSDKDIAKDAKSDDDDGDNGSGNGNEDGVADADSGKRVRAQGRGGRANRKRKFAMPEDEPDDAPPPKRHKRNSKSKSKSKSRSPGKPKTKSKPRAKSKSKGKSKSKSKSRSAPTDSDSENENGNGNGNENGNDENSGDINNDGFVNGLRRSRRKVKKRMEVNQYCMVCMQTDFEDSGGCLVCRHCKDKVCQECIEEHLEDVNELCPSCEKSVTIDDFMTFEEYNNEADDNNDGDGGGSANADIDMNGSANGASKKKGSASDGESEYEAPASLSRPHRRRKGRYNTGSVVSDDDGDGGNGNGKDDSAGAGKGKGEKKGKQSKRARRKSDSSDEYNAEEAGDEEDDEEEEDIDIVANGTPKARKRKSKPKPGSSRARMKALMARTNYNSKYTMETDDDDDDDNISDSGDDNSGNDNGNGDAKSEESERAESPEPQMPERDWTRRRLADFSFDLRVKDDPFYKRDMRCVGSISHGIRSGNMHVLIPLEELRLKIQENERMEQERADFENDNQIAEEVDEKQSGNAANNGDNSERKQKKKKKKNRPKRSPLQLSTEYGKEVGNVLAELAKCVEHNNFITWVKYEQRGMYDPKNAEHNAVLQIQSEEKDADLEAKKSARKHRENDNGNSNNNGNGNDSGDDDANGKANKENANPNPNPDDCAELNAKLKEMSLSNAKEVIFRVRFTVFVNKTCHEKENVDCVTLMKHIGGKKIRVACGRVLELPKQYRECGHTMTLNSLLDFSCRHRLEAGDLVPDFSRRKYGLRVTLRHYQEQAVHWMMKEENHPTGFYRNLFIEGRFPDGKSYFYSPAFHMFSFSKLPVAHGGLLCEEMGLGKTIETLALINCNRREASATQGSFTDAVSKKKFLRTGATLIIAPVSLVGQWEDEIQKKSKKKLTFIRYHSNRTKYQKNPRLICDADVVLTTYGILGQENGTEVKHRLHQIDWWRIVLDESHTIKSKATKSSKNLALVRGANKWLLTGTPFNTTLSDMHNQLAFTNLGKPVETKRWWDEKQKAFTTNSGDKEMVGLFHIMKTLVMRHKKKQNFNGEAIVQLPAKHEDTMEIEFTDVQRANYNKLMATAIQRFKMFHNQGTLGRNSLSLLQALLPARRACSGYTYLQSEIAEKFEQAKQGADLAVQQRKAAIAKEVVKYAAEEAYNADTNQCSVCFEEFEEPLQTPCRHVFCAACIRSWLQEQRFCPFCRKTVTADDLKKPPKSQEQKEREATEKKHNELVKKASEETGGKIVFDAKIKRLIKELNKLRREKPNEKILIFTTFSECLEWICEKLIEHGFSYRTLKGSMTMNKRKKALQEFQNDPPTTVFVLTVRAGAVGITLTAANHVFLMEPPLNPALGRQAVNRVYRLGQTKQVHIHTLVMKDSIESRIVDVNQGKDKETSKIAGNIGRDTNREFKENQITKLFEGLSVPDFGSSSAADAGGEAAVNGSNDA